MDRAVEAIFLTGSVVAVADPVPGAPWWWTWLLPILYFLFVFFGQGAAVLLAYRMPSRRSTEVPEQPVPGLVSVIVPARNEREALGGCLDDLSHQDLARFGGTVEVLVVNDASTDGTRDVAQQHPSRPTVLDAPPLPPGWGGKNWACHTGALAARGERLLFLDADVRLSPQALRAAVQVQLEAKADLVTFAARVLMVGFWEKVVMPLYVQFVLLYFVTPRVNLESSRRAMANGQFMLFSRAGYRRAGGHERVKGAVLEDVRLAQEVKRAGGRVRILWTPDMVTTRMYADRREMAEGILKTLHGTSYSTARQLGLAAGVFVLFLLPFVTLALAVVGVLPFLWLLVSAALILVTLLKQVGFQRALQAPAAYGVLYPLGCLFYLVLFARSIARGRGRRGVEWKGRSYAME